MQESFWWWQCSDRYIISLFPHLHTPSPLLPVPNKPYCFCGREVPYLLTCRSGRLAQWNSGMWDFCRAELRSCVKVEVAVLGSPSLTVHTVSVDAKQHWRTELRSCVKVEVDVLGSPSLVVRTVSVDVKQHWTVVSESCGAVCESRGGRPGLPVSNSPYGLCGRTATLNELLPAMLSHLAAAVSAFLHTLKWSNSNVLVARGLAIYLHGHRCVTWKENGDTRHAVSTLWSLRQWNNGYCRILFSFCF